MSNSDVVIRVEGLGKKYALYHESSERYTALRDVLARQARTAGRLLNPFTLAGQLRRAQRQAALERTERDEEFWALKDVSFEIRRGERVGIIGRNGAGKSTLLKILSRITEPTTGRVEIRGRVASLLEVGTGFHPELTGRENIYLNGAILGMTRREIKRKFDEIVDFAEVEKFLDTPVKRYSSGMYVRLAFAVAAHLEPEILVVDEVLAVGDASFQKKCLGKMENVAEKEGRTVLFVSHQLTAVQALCNRGILLNTGKKVVDDTSERTLIKYSSLCKVNQVNTPVSARSDRGGTGQAKITDISITTVEGSSLISVGDQLAIRLKYESCAPIKQPRIKIGIYDNRHIGVLGLDSNTSLSRLPSEIRENGEIICIPEKVPVNAGLYAVNVALFTRDDLVDHLQAACTLEIVESPYLGPHLPQTSWSIIAAQQHWKVRS